MGDIGHPIRQGFTELGNEFAGMALILAIFGINEVFDPFAWYGLAIDVKN